MLFRGCGCIQDACRLVLVVVFSRPLITGFALSTVPIGLTASQTSIVTRAAKVFGLFEVFSCRTGYCATVVVVVFARPLITGFTLSTVPVGLTASQTSMVTHAVILSMRIFLAVFAVLGHCICFPNHEE